MSTGTLDKDLVAAALEYHRHPTPGKISVVPTKALINQRDLALAYSPGVAGNPHAADERARGASRQRPRGEVGLGWHLGRAPARPIAARVGSGCPA